MRTGYLVTPVNPPERLGRRRGDCGATVWQLDAASAEIFGEAKALLEKQGQQLADADLLIGAIAAAHGASIVTANRKHFTRIPGLTLEDWIRG